MNYAVLDMCIEKSGDKICELVNSFCTIQSNGKEKQYMFIT